MSALTLVARVASASDVSRTYEVKTDGTTLSCPCPGWTRQVHTDWCRAHRGESCNCKHTAAGTSDRRFRTCRHTREVRARVDAVGGLARLLPLLRAGVPVLDNAAQDPALQHAARAEQTTRDAATVRLRAGDPDRLLLNAFGEGRRPNRGIDTWEIVLVRRDGWTMCFPRHLWEAALRVWPTEWVGMMQWPSHQRGVVRFDATLLRRWCVAPAVVRTRAVRPATRTPAPPTPPPSPVPTAPALPSAAPDWLGGRRAIILRE